MKLHLPGNAVTDNRAAFEFERGDFAGRTFTVSLFVCSNPACDCGKVSFDCSEHAAAPRVSPPAEERERAEGAPNPGHYFTLALGQRQVAPPTPSPEAARLASAFVNEMTGADWQSLERLYCDVKRAQTEHIHPDDVEEPFPERVLRDPSLLIGYGEVFRHAETFSTSCFGGHWLVVDQYCVNPRCNCQDTLLNFRRVPEGATRVQSVSSNGPFFFYDHERGTIDPSASNEAEARAVLQALIQKRPDLDRVLGDRHRLLRLLHARQQEAVRPATMQPVRRTNIGRNEPCPCGSGKKYKKCCGNR